VKYVLNSTIPGETLATTLGQRMTEMDMVGLLAGEEIGKVASEIGFRPEHS